MRMRPFLLISLGLNVSLALALLILTRAKKPQPASAPPPPVVVEGTNGATKTHTVVRRQFFNWQEIESDDYRAYIKNLQSIGCPEATIRDIIAAEINGLFEKRRATEVITGEQQWWRSVPDPQVLGASAAKIQQLAAERRAMLTELLGPNWESTNNVSGNLTAPLLDGPILGALSPETKEAIRSLEARGIRQDSSGLGAAANLQARAELAKILNPAQMEEYLLRYSEIAHAMRSELKGLEVTADEFRAIFRIRDAAEQQYFATVVSGDTLRRSDEAAQQSEDAVRQALGTERYQLFRYTRDPAFRQVQSMTEQLGAPPEVVLPVYQISQATEAERQRIRGDLTMTPEQREAAIETVLVQRKESLQRLLGEQIYQQYEAARGN